MDKRALLKQYFGHSDFRPGQEALITALLDGRDVMGVMPTGAGKSVCYQLPALLLPGLTLVLSPLISLMKDQVAALAQAGIPAAYINSSLDAEEYRQVYRRVRRGECRLLYVAPERLQAEGFRRLLGELPVSQLSGNRGAGPRPPHPAPGGGLHRHGHGGGAAGHRGAAGAPGAPADHHGLRPAQPLF